MLLIKSYKRAIVYYLAVMTLLFFHFSTYVAAPHCQDVEVTCPGFIAPDYSSSMFWMSNISLILSPDKRMHENLEDLSEESGIYLYRVVSRMGESLQVALPQPDTGSTKMIIDDPRTC